MATLKDELGADEAKVADIAGAGIVTMTARAIELCGVHGPGEGTLVPTTIMAAADAFAKILASAYAACANDEDRVAFMKDLVPDLHVEVNRRLDTYITLPRPHLKGD